MCRRPATLNPTSQNPLRCRCMDSSSDFEALQGHSNDFNDSSGPNEPPKLVHLTAHKSRFEQLLSLSIFVLLIFVFIRKILLFDPPDLKLKQSFGRSHANVIKGKPFPPDAFSLSIDFASEESGTKIIAYSKSLQNLSSILHFDGGSYMLAPCQTTDWFILSFSESILVQQISFVSNEFYASSYKNIRISLSNTYPSGKFVTLAEVETEPLTNELFDLSYLCNSGRHDCWCKYLKVELLDYHRGEDNYYCALTKMRVYGVTAAEYLESEIGDEKPPYEAGEGAGALEAAGPYGGYQQYGGGSRQAGSHAGSHMGSSVSSSIGSHPASHMGGSIASSIGSHAASHMGSSISAVHTGTPGVGMPDATLTRMLDAKLDASPTFLYDIKSTIVGSLYKFLMALALRGDEYNRRLVRRLLRLGRLKKYCGTNLLFQFSCNRFVTSLLLERYSAYYAHVLDFVRLPAAHHWFERVLFEFARARRPLVYAIVNDVGIREVPVLLCLESFGLVARYKCYFYFNLKSFSTLLFTEFSTGIRFSRPSGQCRDSSKCPEASESAKGAQPSPPESSSTTSGQEGTDNLGKVDENENGTQTPNESSNVNNNEADDPLNTTNPGKTDKSKESNKSNLNQSKHTNNHDSTHSNRNKSTHSSHYQYGQSVLSHSISRPDRFHFFYADGRIEVKHVLSKFRSLIPDAKLVESCEYRVEHDYISSITVVGKLLYVNLAPDSNSYPINLKRGPDVEEKLVRMNRNMYRLDLGGGFTKYFEDRCYVDEIPDPLRLHAPAGKQVQLGFRGRLGDFRGPLGSGLSPQEHSPHSGLHRTLFSGLPRARQAGSGFHGAFSSRLQKLHRKEHRSHKHVLLKLSERIKSLEYLTNKLSNKIYEVERLLNIAISQQLYVHREDKPKRNNFNEWTEALSMLNINRYKIITKGEFSLKHPFSSKRHHYQLHQRHADYNVGYLYMEGDDTDCLANLCKLSKCVPYNKKCQKTLFLYNLNPNFAFFNKSRLIKCAINYSCRCPPHSQLMYSPSGTEEWLYMYDFNLLSRYLSVWSALVHLVKLRLLKYLNVYSIFVLFVLTQIFWICKYNRHNKQIKKLMLVAGS